MLLIMEIVRNKYFFCFSVSHIDVLFSELSLPPTWREIWLVENLSQIKFHNSLYLLHNNKRLKVANGMKNKFTQ